MRTKLMMKMFNSLLLIAVALLPLSCSANDKTAINADTVNGLIKQYFSPEAKFTKNGQPSFKTGDFNGDGVVDIAVLFLPKSKPTTSTQLKVSMPWLYSGVKPSKPLHTSLAIFHRGNDEWLSDKTRAYALLDTTGALETPSFELLVTRTGDKSYKAQSSMLPVKTSNDLIIIPTEAGIDTYIYWDKDNYKLFEPEETP